MPDTAAKLKLVRAYLKRRKLDGVVFRTRSNFAWITGGGDAHVVAQDEGAFCAVVVTARQALLLADDIEAPRFEAEEPVGGLTIRRRPWTQGLSDALKKITAGKKFVSDDPAATGLKPLPADFLDLRAPLDPGAVSQYRQLGRDCVRAIETVARQMSVGDSGWQVEADLARHLLARGVQPHVLLVAFDERLQRYRHPTPAANHLKHHAMLVVCGKRHGLIASLTRMVHFGKLGADLAERHEAVCRVEAAMWAATVPGASYGNVIKAAIAQYKREGFAGEWKLHHQGGPTGYAGRDFLATPDERRVVQDHQAVAWNPSITGTKTEDTFIVNGSRCDVVTACTKAWPTLEVKAPDGSKLSRPAILVR